MADRRPGTTLPPRRRCPSCGATFYAWQTHGVCRRCLAGREPIADTLRQIRLERWAAKGLLPPGETRAHRSDHG